MVGRSREDLASASTAPPEGGTHPSGPCLPRCLHDGSSLAPFAVLHGELRPSASTLVRAESVCSGATQTQSSLAWRLPSRFRTMHLLSWENLQRSGYGSGGRKQQFESCNTPLLLPRVECREHRLPDEMHLRMRQSQRLSLTAPAWHGKQRAACCGQDARPLFLRRRAVTLAPLRACTLSAARPLSRWCVIRSVQGAHGG